MFGEHELNKMLQTKMFAIISEVTSYLDTKTNWPSTYCHLLKVKDQT